MSGKAGPMGHERGALAPGGHACCFSSHAPLLPSRPPPCTPWKCVPPTPPHAPHRLTVSRPWPPQTRPGSRRPPPRSSRPGLPPFQRSPRAGGRTRGRGTGRAPRTRRLRQGSNVLPMREEPSGRERKPAHGVSRQEQEQAGRARAVQQRQRRLARETPPAARKWRGCSCCPNSAW
jgi:hypothetical protein